MKRMIGRVWLLLGLSFFVYVYCTFGARLPESIDLTDSAAGVESTKDYLLFLPEVRSDTIIILYPGALVDPAAYAYLGKSLADSGLATMIVKMPWRLASLGHEKILDFDILKTYTHLILMGHSLGGKQAAAFAAEHPSFIDQLILLGTSHPRDHDLSTSGLSVMKIYGSNDSIARPEDVLVNQRYLPTTTIYHEIAGGNHSQFGYYGFQLGDHAAGISRAEQQDDVVRLSLAFVRSY